MEQKIIQVGNSTGVILPKALLEQAGFAAGNQVIIQADVETQSLIISKKGVKPTRYSITPEFVAIVQRVNELYGDSLKELAQR